MKEREDVLEPPEIAEDIMNVVDTLRKHYEYAHIIVRFDIVSLDKIPIMRLVQYYQDLIHGNLAISSA